MAIQDIEKRILEEASSEAEKIIKEADDKKEKNIREAEEICIACEKGFIERGKVLAGAKKREMLTPERLKAKRDFLKAKQDIIDSAFSEALKSLSSLNKATYKKYLLGLCKKIPANKDIEIVPKKGDERLIKEVIKDVFKGKDKKGGYKILKAKKGMSGGFIVKAGKIEIDLSFDSFIKGLREELEGEVSGVLFK